MSYPVYPQQHNNIQAQSPSASRSSLTGVHLPQLLHHHSLPNVLNNGPGSSSRKRLSQDDLLYLPAQRLAIEQNVSYTRSVGGSGGKSKINNSHSNNNNGSNGIGSPILNEPLLPRTIGVQKSSANYHRQKLAAQLADLPDNNGAGSSRGGASSSRSRKFSNASESDEDERFLRLAKEALVATAGAKGNGSEDLMVDPTIQDLLRRLQYAASPHGNPIKRSKKIRANENGQLQIQGFYKNFPNLSNNIFMESEGIGILNSAGENGIGGRSAAELHDKLINHPSNSRSDGWNFLVGEPLVYKTEEERKLERLQQQQLLLLLQQKQGFDDDDDDEANDNDLDSKKDDDEEGSNETRKYACTKCLMSFRRSSDLKRHEKQHLTIPPNICELCGKGFARKDALKRHMGTLTCKRNADKRLYTANLSYVGQNKGASSANSASNIINRNEFQSNESNDWQIQ